jgi:hypothetical protein
MMVFLESLKFQTDQVLSYCHRTGDFTKVRHWNLPSSAQIDVRFWAVTEITMITLFWDVTPGTLVDTEQFGETYCLHLQDFILQKAELCLLSV